jgi:hypothetical protein
MVEVWAKEDEAKLIQKLKTFPFSIATDGSTDMEATKLYPLVVRYFDFDAGKMKTVLLSLKELKGPSTGENIYNLVDEELRRKEIPWKNVMSFAMDNASVMTGKNKGVAAFIDRDNPHVFIAGCSCHLIHLAASKGGAKLQEDMNVTVEDALVKIYFYIDKSSKRKEHVETLQIEEGMKSHKILKLAQTRWLSLEDCTRRLVAKWDALFKFFKSEAEGSEIVA